MAEADNLITTIKAIFQKAKPIMNKVSLINMIKEFVKNGILKEDCDALNRNVDTEADVELLISRLKPQLLKIEKRPTCLSIMENHGVCVHNHSQLMQFITCETELPSCFKKRAQCTRQRAQSLERTGNEKSVFQELQKSLHLPGVQAPNRIDTELKMPHDSASQIGFDNVIDNSITMVQSQSKPGIQRQISERESLRNRIIGNWKHIKKNIHLNSFVENCLNEDLLDFEDVESNEKLALSTSRKIDVILRTVVRNINEASEFDKFLKLLDEDEHQHHIVERLKNPVQPGWIDDEIDTKQSFHRLNENRVLLEKEIRPQKCVDDFLEGFILSLDEHEEIWRLGDGRKKMAEYLFDRILSSVDKGSYNILMRVLEEQIPKRLKSILEKLESTTEIQETRRYETSVILKYQEGTCSEQTDSSKKMPITLVIELGHENQHCEKMIMENIAKFAPAFLGKCGFYPNEIKKGSVVVYLDPVSGECMVELKKSIKNGELVKILGDLFNCDDIKKCLSPGNSCIKVSIAVDKTQSSEVKSAITLSEDNDQESILRASKKLLLEEIDPLTLLDGFTQRNCHIFDSSKLSQIKTKKERTEKFIEILQTEEERCFDLFLEVLEEKKMLFVLKILQLWRQVRLTDISVICQNILQNISEISDELYIEDIQGELIERNISSEDVFGDLMAKFPDNSQQQVIEIIVDLLKAGRTSLLIDIMLRNGMDALVSKMLLSEKKAHSEDDKNCQVVVCGKGLHDGVLFEGVINLKVNVIDARNNEQKIIPSLEDTLMRLENCSTKLEHVIGNLEHSFRYLSDLKKTLLQRGEQLRSSGNCLTSDLEKCNENVELINRSIAKVWNINENTDTLTLPVTENEELNEKVFTLQCFLSGSDAKPNVEKYDITPAFATKKSTSADDTKSELDEIDTHDSHLTEKRESLVKSNKIYAECKKVRRPFKRKLNQTGFVTFPGITIKTHDGSFKYVNEKHIPISSAGNILMDGLHEEDVDTIMTMENIVTKKAKTENDSDEARTTKGAYSKDIFKDKPEMRMTEKEWRKLCEIEKEKGQKLTLEELPQVCAPDTIILIDLSGSVKGTAVADIKAAVHDFLDKRIATRQELSMDENIAMVIFGHKTEVKHHLTSDYNIVRQHLETLPEPGGPSPLLPGLQLCNAVIESRGKVSFINGKTNGSTFYPRILLITDGNLTPSECVIGNKNLQDLNITKKDEETKMDNDLFNICREFRNQKIQITCIPVGCCNKTRLQLIADTTNGKVLNKDKAVTLGNERMKMVYAKELQNGSMSEDELKSKLLSLRSISANDFDDIKEMSENLEKYGMINEEDNSDELREVTREELSSADMMAIIAAALVD